MTNREKGNSRIDGDRDRRGNKQEDRLTERERQRHR